MCKTQSILTKSELHFYKLLFTGCNSPMTMLFAISRASVEWPTSSKLSVASPPPCSLSTSSPPGCCKQSITILHELHHQTTIVESQASFHIFFLIWLPHIELTIIYQHWLSLNNFLCCRINVLLKSFQCALCVALRSLCLLNLKTYAL